ncbi:hypothetical protein FPANT_1437 [Fusarium pseudoanthophilum]|uniref:Uncharacterized protein n=1 Tax=Fusarium pseudoanthophilum TaxID=48495 RepID=A0A8H5PYD8_9HYPO|nr:hypothetical protein FPANT_1437 [Fusarium pseudoanthophilum]
MAVLFPDSKHIGEAQSQSPDLQTTENEEFEHEITSYILNEPRIFIDSLGHTYSDMKSNQEPYSTYAKIVTIPRKKVQEPVTFTSRHTITLTSMATLTSFTTIFETEHLGPVDPLPKVTSKITTHITITAVKDPSTSSAQAIRPAIDPSPLSPPSVDASTDPSLWSTVTISDKILPSSVLTTSYTTDQDEPNLPTATTEVSSSNDSLTAAKVAPIAVGVFLMLATICLIIFLWLRRRRNRKRTGTRVPRGVEASRSNPAPSNSPYGQELKPILAPYRSTKENTLLTTDARHMSFEIDEYGRNKGLKHYRFEPCSSSRHPDGRNIDLDQDPQWKGKERAE